MKGFFGGEEIRGDATLAAIGENEAYGGTEDGSAESDPGEKRVAGSDGAGHEDDQQRHDEREELGGEKSFAAGGGRGDGDTSGRFTIEPVGGEENDDEIGEHGEKIAPTGIAGRGGQRKQIIGVGDDGKEEHESQDRKEITKPRGRGGAGSVEKSRGEKKVASDVNGQNSADQRVLVSSPARSEIEEVEVGSDGNDGDLEEIETAQNVDALKFFLRTRKQDHEDRSGPNEEEDVGRFSGEGGARDEALVIRTENLSTTFSGDGNGQQDPDLADITG